MRCATAWSGAPSRSRRAGAHDVLCPLVDELASPMSLWGRCAGCCALIQSNAPATPQVPPLVCDSARLANCVCKIDLHLDFALNFKGSHTVTLMLMLAAGHGRSFWRVTTVRIRMRKITLPNMLQSSSAGRRSQFMVRPPAAPACSRGTGACSICWDPIMLWPFAAGYCRSCLLTTACNPLAILPEAPLPQMHWRTGASVAGFRA